MTDRIRYRTHDHSNGRTYFTRLVIHEGNGSEKAVMIPGLHAPGPLDPQDPVDAELIIEALRLIDRCRVSRESLDHGFLQGIAESLRCDGGVAQATACYLIRGLVDVYKQKLQCAATEQGTAAITRQYPHIREITSSDGDPGLEVDATGWDIQRAIDRIGALVQDVLDNTNGWLPLSEWLMTLVVAWAAEELEDEHGHEWLASLSYEEFDNRFMAKLFSDGNIASKGIDALQHFMQQFIDPLIEDARGEPSSVVGQYLGLADVLPKRGRRPRTPTGYDRGTWLAIARELRQRRDEGATFPELAEWLGVEDWRTPKRWLCWYEEEASIA